MRITTDTLYDNGACLAGISAFRTVFPDGFSGEWTADAQMWVLAFPQTRRYLGWAWHNGLVPMWSLRDANLCGAYLRWPEGFSPSAE